MKIYALIAGGRVAELLPETVEIDGTSYGMAERYPPDMVAACVALSAAQAKKVQPGWAWDGQDFAAPPAVAAEPAPAPSGDALLAQIREAQIRLEALLARLPHDPVPA